MFIENTIHHVDRIEDHPLFSRLKSAVGRELTGGALREAAGIIAGGLRGASRGMNPDDVADYLIRVLEVDPHDFRPITPARLAVAAHEQAVLDAQQKYHNAQHRVRDLQNQRRETEREINGARYSLGVIREAKAVDEAEHRAILTWPDTVRAHEHDQTPLGTVVWNRMKNLLAIEKALEVFYPAAIASGEAQLETLVKKLERINAELNQPAGTA